ncbi:MAG: efflux RND transporter permease subunit, partial [Eubacteriales bacterium]|nr:efflux RND transporter permease subunit [Eubacteriales bacterium]
MFSKYSVRKPFTVLVAVILVVVLGVVSYMNMTPDLLPKINLPYVVVMTTYVGATPETVESEVTRPIEQSLSTLDDVDTITSTSGASYSVVF